MQSWQNGHAVAADFCETLISISKSRVSRKTLVSFSISTFNFVVRTLILILNSHPQNLKNLRNLDWDSVDFSGKFSHNFDASMIKISILRGIQNYTLALNQTSFVNSRVSISFSISFFPSELSFSFSTLKFFTRTLILILNSQKFPRELSFSISTLSKLTLAEVCAVVAVRGDLDNFDWHGGRR